MNQIPIRSGQIRYTPIGKIDDPSAYVCVRTIWNNKNNWECETIDGKNKMWVLPQGLLDKLEIISNVPII